VFRLDDRRIGVSYPLAAQACMLVTAHRFALWPTQPNNLRITPPFPRVRWSEPLADDSPLSSVGRVRVPGAVPSLLHTS